jgi:hypothetical protein
MATKQKDGPREDREPSVSGQLTDTIGRNVLQILGRPDDLQRVMVRLLWADHFRVNIFVGNDASSVRVANSYFLVADGAGNIINSVPAITRQH